MIARAVLKRSDHDARLVVAQKLGEKAIVEPDIGRLEFPAAFQESMRRGGIIAKKGSLHSDDLVLVVQGVQYGGRDLLLKVRRARRIVERGNGAERAGEAADDRAAGIVDTNDLLVVIEIASTAEFTANGASMVEKLPPCNRNPCVTP